MIQTANLLNTVFEALLAKCGLHLCVYMCIHVQVKKDFVPRDSSVSLHICESYHCCELKTIQTQSMVHVLKAF